MWRRALTLGVSVIVALSGCGRNASEDGVRRLSGGGSTFVGPLMKKWATEYHAKKGIEIDYALKGSGNGIQQMTVKTYHFGCTDAPMTDEQLQKAREKGGEVLHIPLAMGAVVPIYNVPDLNNNQPLRFTGAVLADIFLGKITKWNHESLKKLNPGVELPARGIVVVHRAEPSGTTFIWTDYLAQVSPEWQRQVGPGRIEIQWPTGIGKQGNPEVANHVAKAPGAIGYVELIYALNNKIAFGSVQNRDGEFIDANVDSVTAAARAASSDIPDSLTFTLTNKPGKDNYPICGTVWAVIYQEQLPAVGKTLVDFLRWTVHEGQDLAGELHYARLPRELIERINKKLDSVKLKSTS